MFFKVKILNIPKLEIACKTKRAGPVLIQYHTVPLYMAGVFKKLYWKM